MMQRLFQRAAAVSVIPKLLWLALAATAGCSPSITPAGPTTRQTPPPATRNASAPAGGREVDAKAGSPVFADPGDANRVVFVFDSTGAMMQKAASAVDQISGAIAHLRPDQSFGLILYTDGGAARPLSNALIASTAANKRMALKFLDDLIVTGDADARPALRLAFEMKPDVIYYFSASANNLAVPYSAVVAEVARLNRARKVKVHTILYDVYKNEVAIRSAMRQIASDNGGTFRDWNESEEFREDRPRLE